MQRYVWLRRSFTDLLSGPRVVFHHVPKCGGTSVAQALHLRYIVSFAAFPTLPVYRMVGSLHPNVDERERDRLVDDFHERLLLFYLYGDARCVSGHVRFSNVAYERFAQSYRFITTLRNPISLLISNYFFQWKRPSELWPIHERIEDFLESEEAAAIGGVYSHFFNGLPPESDPHSAMAIELAKENLQRFDLIGLTDDIPDFQRRLRRELGIRLRIGYANKTTASKSERASVITPAVRRRIEDLSATNLEIYDFVKSELAQRSTSAERAGGTAWRLGGA